MPGGQLWHPQYQFPRLFATFQPEERMKGKCMASGFIFEMTQRGTHHFNCHPIGSDGASGTYLVPREPGHANSQLGSRVLSSNSRPLLLKGKAREWTLRTSS